RPGEALALPECEFARPVFGPLALASSAAVEFGSSSPLLSESSASTIFLTTPAGFEPAVRAGFASGFWFDETAGGSDFETVGSASTSGDSAISSASFDDFP